VPHLARAQPKMPQYNGPALITELLAADIILVWQDSSAANKTIEFSDLVTSVQALLSKEDTVNILSSNTTLDDSYQFVVCNSGGTFTIVLPDASDNPGLKFGISNKGAGTVTVQRTGGDVIAAGGAVGATTTVTQYNSYTFQSDGVDSWFRSS
jgi:hypothetical protein